MLYKIQNDDPRLGSEEDPRADVNPDAIQLLTFCQPPNLLPVSSKDCFTFSDSRYEVYRKQTPTKVLTAVSVWIILTLELS